MRQDQFASPYASTDTRPRTFSHGAHNKIRVGGNDDEKRTRGSFQLVRARLPVMNSIHRQTETLCETPLA
jgi:hypothetical protein